MSTVAERIVKGGMWLTLSRALVNGLTTLSTFVLAWYLSPSDFGLVSIGMTVMLILTAITELSLGQALIRHEAPTMEHFDTVWTLNALRGLILALLFAASAYPLGLIYNEPQLVGVVLALSFSLFMGGLTNPRRVMLQRQLVFHQEFVLNVSQKLVGFLVTVVVAITFRSHWALVMGTLAYQLTNIIVSYTVLPYRPRVRFTHTKELFSFSAWLTLGQIVNTLNWRIEYLIIGRFLGTASLGFYTVGSTLSSMPTRETTAPLNQAIYPGLAKVKDNPERLRTAYQRSQALISAIALPAGIGMAILAEPMIRLVFGEKWLPIIFIIQALASVYALQTLGSLVQPLGMALGNTRALFMRDAQMLVVRLPIIIIGLIFWGLPGAVYARVLTGIMSAAVNMFLVRSLISLPVVSQLRANLRALIAVTVMAAGVFGALQVTVLSVDRLVLAGQTLALVVLGAVLYVATTLACWWVSGRKEGPEMELARLFGKLVSKVQRLAVRRSATPSS